MLLSRPEREVHCLELMGGHDAAGGPLPALDEQARQQYRARIHELREELATARAHNDPLPAERAEAELDALMQQLSASFGIGGRARRNASAVERARSAVSWRTRAAIQRIARVHPELGRHLDNAVHTGTYCIYRPETPVAWLLGPFLTTAGPDSRRHGQVPATITLAGGQRDTRKDCP